MPLNPYPFKFATVIYLFMKKLFLFLFILKTSISFGQIKAKVVDANTLLGIPFVNIWIENTPIGTTANANGEFLIEIKKRHPMVPPEYLPR